MQFLVYKILIYEDLVATWLMLHMKLSLKAKYFHYEIFTTILATNDVSYSVYGYFWCHLDVIILMDCKSKQVFIEHENEALVDAS